MPQQRLIKLELALVNPPSDIQLGMTANVIFTGANNGDTNISLPLSALYQVEIKLKFGSSMMLLVWN